MDKVSIDFIFLYLAILWQESSVIFVNFLQNSLGHSHDSILLEILLRNNRWCGYVQLNK